MKKTYLIISSFLLISLISFFIFFQEAWALSSLGNKIQKELDANPFLKKAKIKLEVTEEENGYVTIEMLEGNRKIREGINNGYDIFTPQFDMKWMGFISRSPSVLERKTLNTLRKSLSYIKENIKGVKEIMLTAAINTIQDQADDLNDKALKLQKENKFKEAAKFYRQAAEMGNPYAQFNLAILYLWGEGVLESLPDAVYWVRESAEQGYCRAQEQLGHFFYSGAGVEQSYAKALVWWGKAAEQDKEVKNNIAWLYATCKDQKYHNGKKAVEYALEATAQNPDNWNYCCTLAAAYARNRQFDKAVQVAKKSILLLKNIEDVNYRDEQLESAYQRLELYKDSKAYTEE